MLSNQIGQKAVYLQAGLFGGIVIVSSLIILREGVTAWVPVPPGYAARVASFIWVGGFSLLELPKFGWKTFGMTAFVIGFVELTYSIFANIGCSQAFVSNVIASGGWAVWSSHIAVWIELPLISFLLLKPKMSFNLSIPIWGAWMLVWVVLGAPVMNGFCGGYTVVPTNYLYEIVNGVTTYGMVYFTFHPR